MDASGDALAVERAEARSAMRFGEMKTMSPEMKRVKMRLERRRRKVEP